MIFNLFLIWRTADIVITLIAERVIPYLGFFPYRGALFQYRLPPFLMHLASFDGVHYTQIADDGYAQNEQAFFPLYPMLIKALTFITHNRLASGLIISNAAFLAGLYLFHKFAKTEGLKTKAVSAVLFLLLFPTSFYFGAVYTEGLFFFLLISSLYFLRKKKYMIAATFAALSSSTRLIGVFLFIPFVCAIIENHKISLRLVFTRAFRHLPFILSPFVGFLLYALYLWKTVGDPLFFFHAQPSFGANRSTSIILLPQVYYRYLKIFITASFNFQYLVSLIEFITFTFVLVILLLDLKKHYKNKSRLTLNIFSMVNLILPTLTGTFSSVPRYALFSFSMYFYMADISRLWLKKALYIVFVLLHIILLGLFIQGYFIS